MIDSEALRTLLRRDPLLYVDAGARGDLEGGWHGFPQGCLSVLAFEPDQNAEIAWDGGTDTRHLERSALWSEDTEVDIHIGKVSSTSSVWPPNIAYLERRFDRRHIDPRVTQSVAKVRARPLDLILAERSQTADFLKIDTQGSELQILQGASAALDNSLLGAIVETWTVPVHAGQGLTHDIMALMQGKGFLICQMGTAAKWDRKIVETVPVSNRRQIVGLDILFMRDPALIEARLRSPALAAKFAVIAQLYGHYDLALEALDIAAATGMEAPLLAAARQDIIAAHAALNRAHAPSLVRRILNRLRPPRRAEPSPETELHY